LIYILDVGELELNEDDIVIAPLVEETVALIKSQQMLSNIELRLMIDENLPSLRGDRQRV